MDTQLKEVGKTFPEAHENGLLNDLLYFFINEDLVCTTHSIDHIIDTYRHLPEDYIKNICDDLETHFLLSRHGIDGKPYFRLCHDALIFPVLQRFNESEAAGQMLMRAIKEADKNNLTEVPQYVVRSVYVGLQGCRLLTDGEKEIINFSWKKHLNGIVREDLAKNKIGESIDFVRNYLVELEANDLKPWNSLKERFTESQQNINQGLHTEEEALVISNIYIQIILSLLKSLHFQERKKRVASAFSAVKNGDLRTLLIELDGLKVIDHGMEEELNFYFNQFSNFIEKYNPHKYEITAIKPVEMALLSIYPGFFTFLYDKYVLSDEYFYNVLSLEELAPFQEITKSIKIEESSLTIITTWLKTFNIENISIFLAQFYTFLYFKTNYKNQKIYKEVDYIEKRLILYLEDHLSIYSFNNKSNRSIQSNFELFVHKCIFENQLNKGYFICKNFTNLTIIHELLDKTHAQIHEFNNMHLFLNKNNELLDIIEEQKIKRNQVIISISDLAFFTIGNEEKFKAYLNDNPVMQKDIWEKLKEGQLIEAFGTFDELAKMKPPSYLFLLISKLKEIESQYKKNLILRESYYVEINTIRLSLLELIDSSLEVKEELKPLTNRLKNIKDRIVNYIEIADDQEVFWALEDLTNLFAHTRFSVELTHLTSRYKKTRKDILNRKIHFDDIGKEMYNLNDSIIYLIDIIESEIRFYADFSSTDGKIHP